MGRCLMAGQLINEHISCQIDGHGLVRGQKMGMESNR
jgi:hypothetical protein